MSNALKKAAITASAVLALSAAGPSSARMGSATAWAGELHVLAEAGPACASKDRSPASVGTRLPIHIVALPGTHEDDVASDRRSHVAWGQFQAVILNAPVGTSVIEGRPLAAGAGWTVTVDFRSHAGDDVLRGTWREAATGTPEGCLFDQAQFELRRITDPAQVAQAVARAQALVDLHAFLGAIGRARTADAWRDATAALLKAYPPNMLEDAADREIATLLLQEARTGWALGQRSAAAVLASRSVAMFRSLGPGEAASAARAMRREAGMLRRLAGPQVGHARLSEAVEWLAQHGLSDSEDMADLLGAQGAWLLQDGELDAARNTFARAARLEFSRPASARRQAVALHNWAAALQEARLSDEASALWLRALALLADTSDPADRALERLIEQALARARSGAMSA